MKQLILFFTLLATLLANTYYAKVEPLQMYDIKASVAGKVVYSDTASEGSFVEERVIVKLDDYLDKAELEATEKKIASINNSINILTQNMKNAKKSEDIRKRHYELYKSMKSKSKFDKDKEMLAYISATTAYLNIKNQIQNLNIQLSDLKYKRALIKDKISKKEFKAKNRYIYAILVKEGDFANVGKPIYKAYDTSKAKLTIFVSKEDVENIKNKTVYINGKKSRYKVSKVWRIADSKFISSYRVEIVIDRVEFFSKVVKVELKDE
jgi:multidrug resistance efflux pump